MARALVGNLGETVSKISDTFTDLPKINVPLTNIVNRGQITDFASDGLPKYGVDRIITQTLVELYDETGPAGQRVWKATNDIHDQIRFYGPWTNPIDVNGQRPQGATGAVCEITFYGTGLNLLRYNDSSNRTFSYSVDGGASTNVTGAWSDTILARNYNPNIIFNLTANLTLGWHTVILTSSSNAMGIFGFEVINSGASIFLPATTTYSAGRRLSAASGTTAYNSGFESGTLGTVGGHVLVYQKSDGTIAKAVTPTNASPAYLSSADHTNEELVRRINPREFAAARSDDFSTTTVNGSQVLAYTLDDGTTTLMSSGAYFNSSHTGYLGNNTVGVYFVLTFVGTGLDITHFPFNTTGTQTWSVTIDGVAQGSYDVTADSGLVKKYKICSGLPYGTHNVRITTTANPAGAQLFTNFDVYAPRTPTLPSGAVAICDYFIMANFVANSTAGMDRISTGVLRKISTREVVYVNGTGGTVDWQVGGSPFTSNIAGPQLETNRQNAYFEYTFFGTGFDYRFPSISSGSANIQLSLQSLSTGGSLQNLTTANFPTISSSVYGTGAAFNAATGVMDQLDASNTVGCGLVISGLPLGLYKVRFLNNTASSYIIPSVLDVITPVYAPKEIGPVRTQNVAMIGSSAIRDLRNFSPKLFSDSFFKPYSQCQGVHANGFMDSGVASQWIPLKTISTTIKITKNTYIEVSFQHSVFDTTSANTDVYHRLYLNGIGIGVPTLRTTTVTANTTIVHGSITWRIPVSPGTHKIDVYWNSSTTTVRSADEYRVMTVKEV